VRLIFDAGKRNALAVIDEAGEGGFGGGKQRRTVVGSVKRPVRPDR
jgi:hypothetical protein